MVTIKFTRAESKDISRDVTPRRIAAAERALKRERDKTPLFADAIARQQPSPKERIQKFDEDFGIFWRRMRDLTAKHWRRGRKNLRSWPKEHQEKAVAYFNNGMWPKDGTYFCDRMRSYARKNNLPFED